MLLRFYLDFQNRDTVIVVWKIEGQVMSFCKTGVSQAKTVNKRLHFSVVNQIQFMGASIVSPQSFAWRFFSQELACRGATVGKCCIFELNHNVFLHESVVFWLFICNRVFCKYVVKPLWIYAPPPLPPCPERHCKNCTGNEN